jgi:peroxisomal 3,2-trans-enoyl-CoA isomerase
MSSQSLRQRYVGLFQQDPSFGTNILSEVRGSRCYLTLNRPKRYNAFSPDMYYSFAQLLTAANENPLVKFIVVSGSGANFCSGNDLANFTDSRYMDIATVEQKAQESADQLEELAATIIKSRKPIFAVTEGKVIGFAFTQLALYDRVFAVDGSEYHAPLVQLAQGPEMCASYTFPKLFGAATAEDLIFKGRKVGAAFLEAQGFLTAHKSRQAAEQALEKHLEDLETLEWNSYVASRELFREREAKILLEVNHRECSNLVQRWINPDLPAHLMQYMARVKQQPKL